MYFDEFANAILKEMFRIDAETGKKANLHIYIDKNSYITIKRSMADGVFRADDLFGEEDKIFGFPIYEVLSDVKHLKIYNVTDENKKT